MFDPADHTVAEVLEAVGDDPAAAAQALAAEQNGKARATLLAALEAVTAPTGDTDGVAEDPDRSASAAGRSAGDGEPAPLVRGRWVSVQSVYAVEQGLVLYGDQIMATGDQIADPRTPIVEWDDDWVPDDDLHRQSRLFDARSADEVPEGFVHNPRS